VRDLSAGRGLTHQFILPTAPGHNGKSNAATAPYSEANPRPAGRHQPDGREEPKAAHARTWVKGGRFGDTASYSGLSLAAGSGPTCNIPCSSAYATSATQPRELLVQDKTIPACTSSTRQWVGRR
jgi:hypothetical protein